MRRPVALAIVSVVLAVSRPSFGDGAAKRACEALMKAVLTPAQMMLYKRGAVVPFGATMSPSGEVATMASPTPSEAQQEVKQRIAQLERSFQEGASAGRHKATALALNVVMAYQGKNGKGKEMQDAIEVRLDHRDGYSVRVMFPYWFDDRGILKLGKSVAVQGDGKIFAPAVTPK
jgi:hypothetical protein